MPDDVNDVNDDPGGVDTQPGDDDSFDFDALPDNVKNHIRALRGEAKGYRLDKRDLEQQLNTTQGKMSAIEQTRKTELEREGNFEQLTRQQEIELSELRIKADEGAKYRASVEASNSRIIAELPVYLKELADDLVVDLSPDKMQTWLGKHSSKLTAAPVPNLDGGAGGQARGKPSAKLTADEKKMAAAMKMSEEEYAARK